jgi:hypothetical protein
MSAIRRRRDCVGLGEIARLFSRLLPPPSMAGWVTALFLMIAASGTVKAGNPDIANLRAFDFTALFELPQSPGRLDGVMASDGSRHRIAIYWIEPYVYREGEMFLRCGDFIVTPEAVHYWIHGEPHPGVFRLPADGNAPLLPRTTSIQPIVQSALALMSRGSERSLEMGKFFQDSRGRTALESEVSPADMDDNSPPPSWDSDQRILNSLPYGREYLKAQPAKGVVGWRLRRSLDRQLLTAVQIKPREIGGYRSFGDIFDPNTLGRWALVPEPYAMYWSFDQACADLGQASDKRAAGRQLFDRIRVYLADTNVPPRVCRGLERLQFKAALETGDPDCVWQATRAAVAGLCGDSTVTPFLCLLQLGSMSGKIERQYPQQVQERLRPLVAQAVQHAGTDLAGDLDTLMKTTDMNGWFAFGNFVLAEARPGNLAQAGVLDRWQVRLERSRLARDRQAFDPNEATGSVRRYLLQLDADPPEGSLDVNGIRRIIESGIAGQFKTGDGDAQREMVNSILRTIHSIAGEGPFIGNAERLGESVERFAKGYVKATGSTRSMDAALATFLALSFCDVSTAEDHALLRSQFGGVCDRLEGQIDEMLSKRELSSVVTPADVNGMFSNPNRVFRTYVDDPLWPAFKFPFTANEQTRLTSKLQLQIAQLEPLLDEISLKIKYAGADAQRVKTLTDTISRAVGRLLLETAALRQPPYPDVSFQYLGSLGFTATIPAGIYSEAGRAREVFKAMKYFHLGHRLESVARREAESARVAANAAPRREAASGTPTD